MLCALNFIPIIEFLEKSGCAESVHTFDIDMLAILVYRIASSCYILSLKVYMKIYLDDERPTPEGWVRVYWPEEAILLLESGSVTEISLDHDLGDDERGTGYDVVLWIEEAVMTRGFRSPKITVHSANSSAKQKMEAGIRSIQAFADQQCAS